MESNKEESTIEEIYSCIKCHYPLSSSYSVKIEQNTYSDLLKIMNEKFDTKNNKCIFIVPKDSINDLIGDRFCFGIKYKKEKIFCKKDDAIVGFIKTIKDEEVSGIELVFGYLNMKKIEIAEVGFKLSKEIPFYSQEQYTVLARLKQLRYYVKQLSPILRNSIEHIKEEQKSIFEIEDKFEKSKLNIVINKVKEIQKDINSNNNEKNNDK